MTKREIAMSVVRAIGSKVLDQQPDGLAVHVIDVVNSLHAQMEAAWGSEPPYTGEDMERMASAPPRGSAPAVDSPSEPRYVPVESSGPKDVDKLRTFADQEWSLLKSSKFPGYCAGSKTGSCGDDFANLTDPRYYIKGIGTICVPCYEQMKGM